MVSFVDSLETNVYEAYPRIGDCIQSAFRAARVVLPGMVIAVVCLAFDLFGNALRDAFDPTRK
ncbi:MAG: hypothetical protein JWM61_3196 [Micrococcaceae bacterium]|jgi:ABC-type dipeptide/oligopeptide/nickel transport system permease subunit|nr:hypothetical protein [Micrococcaceae bacterium]